MSWHCVERCIYQKLDPAGQPWPGLYLKVSVNGRSKFWSAGTRDLAQARRQRTKLLAEQQAGRASRLRIGART